MNEKIFVEQRVKKIGDDGKVVGVEINIHSPESKIPLELPKRHEHFIGRVEELENLLSSLQPGNIITLCGPGGIGKSALAAEAIWTLTSGKNAPEMFPDGVVWYDFYKRPGTEMALEHIAMAFGEVAAPSPLDAAQRALSGKTALLLLDGTEECCNLPMVIKIIGNCGVIVTSRKKKDAAAERQDIESLEPDEAVKLLMAWAGDQIGKETSARRICELIGGLPLVVRLAGRYMSETGWTADEYLEFLEDRILDALDHGNRKSESVPLIIESSIEKFSEHAKDIMAVAGILAFGSFSKDVIKAALPKARIWKPLGETVSYGLLARSGNRYITDHALIHTYARERLILPDDGIIVRIAKYYISFIEEQSARGADGYASLDLERVHILNIIEACGERQEWKTVSDLALSMGTREGYLAMQCWWTEWKTVLEFGIEAAKNANNRFDENTFLNNLSIAYRFLGQAGKAIEYCEQALAISRETGDRGNEGKQIGNLGITYRDIGQFEKAIEHCEQALAISREIDDRRNEGKQIGNLGIIYGDLGQAKKAIEHYEQALSISREIGDRRTEGKWLGNFGCGYFGLKQVENAIEYFKQALAISREIGDKRLERIQIGNLASCFLISGYKKEGDTRDFARQIEKAIDLFEQALSLSRKTGNRLDEETCLGNMGIAYSELGQSDKAMEYCEQALAVARETGDRHMESQAVRRLCKACSNLGQNERIIEYCVQALSVSRGNGDRRNEQSWLGNLGITYSELGHAQKAVEYYEQALTISRETGDKRSEQVWLINLGVDYNELGHSEKAIAYCEQALAVSREIGDRKIENEAVYRLGKACTNLGQTEKAIEYYEKAIAISKDFGDREMETVSILALADEYRKQGTSFRETNLSGVSFRGVNLLGADFRGANLRSTDLREANLIAADLRGTNLEGAKLQGTKLDFIKIDQNTISQIHEEIQEEYRNRWIIMADVSNVQVQQVPDDPPDEYDKL